MVDQLKQEIIELTTSNTTMINEVKHLKGQVYPIELKQLYMEFSIAFDL